MECHLSEMVRHPPLGTRTRALDQAVRAGRPVAILLERRSGEVMWRICGKLNFYRQEFGDLTLVPQMMDLLQHRGPDGSGEYRSGPIGLGHRRLSIIGLSTGAQLMSNKDGMVCVAYT